MGCPEVEIKLEKLTEPQILHVEQALDLELMVSGCYGYESDKERGLMLVEPLSAPPYVVQLPGTLYRFHHSPGAQLLARKAACRLFAQLQTTTKVFKEAT
jgi:hypothetical protein